MKILMGWLMLVWSAMGLTINEPDHETANGGTDLESAAPEYMILTGKLIEQTHINDIHDNHCLDGTVICLWGYYRNKIKTEDVIVGDVDKGIFEAISRHHNHKFVDVNETVLFVISEMQDQKSIELFGTQFFADEISVLEFQQCLNQPLNNYIPELTNKSNCRQPHHLTVKDNDIAKVIRSELVRNLFDQYNTQLSDLRWLISSNDDWSDGTEVVDTDEIDVTCERLDLSANDPNVDCDYSELFDANFYVVTKGLGAEAQKLFQQQLQDSRLNLEPFDIRYRVIEHGDHSEFQVHYKY